MQLLKTKLTILSGYRKEKTFENKLSNQGHRFQNIFILFTYLKLEEEEKTGRLSFLTRLVGSTL